MTDNTMLAVVEELQRRGVTAEYEYPGYIGVYLKDGFGQQTLEIKFGDANETIDGDVFAPNDDGYQPIEIIESSIPSDSTDVQRIADHIACCYTQAQEVAGQ